MKRPVKNSDDGNNARHWHDQRCFLAARLRWVGTIQRKDIQNHFGVTYQTASAILQKYSAEVGGLRYNSSRKCYVFTQETTTTKAISLHEAWQIGALQNENPVCTETLQIREPETSATRTILQALGHKATASITYMGTRKPTDQTRCISPTHLVWDGERWHIRAYCHTANGYRNFVLARIAQASLGKPLLVPEDTEWEQTEPIELMINPQASAEAQAAWRLEYQTQGDRLTLPVRKANLLTTKCKLGITPTDKPFVQATPQNL